jgi:cell wall-associated NlpC family hydrolase
MRQSRSLLAVVAAVVLSLALGIPVAADLYLVPGDSAQVAYTNGDGVNVRTEPGYTGGIISTLWDGVEVTITDGPLTADDGSSWYYISADTYDGLIEGWVIADYVSGDPNYDAASVSSAQLAVASDAGGTATVVNTDGYGLRLRDGTSLEAGILTVMPEGAAVTVLDRGFVGDAGVEWAQIEYDGTTGYAAVDYLSIGGGGATTEAVPATEAAPADASSLTVGDHAAVVGTNGGGLNVRSEGYYGAAVLTVVPESGVVTIVDGPAWDGEGNAWYQVDYSSTVGWVHGGYLSWTDAAPTSTPALGSVQQPVEEAPAEQAPPVETQTPVEQAPAEEPPATVEAPAAPEVPVAPVTGVGDSIVAEALNYVGIPYVWGGTTPSGFDCSGFTYYVVNKVTGMGLSRDMGVQVVTGTYVSGDNLAPGDLVFFQNTYKWGLSHVGIYIGGGQFVHAGSERTGVTISGLSDSYWGQRYYTARRIV